MIQIPLEIGDTILAGRFKNKKITVKEIGIDDFGSPTVNGRSILKIRIPKLYQKQENNMKLKENKTQILLTTVDSKINWSSDKNMPFSQGYAINQLIKTYKIPAIKWGFAGSGKYIGIETNNQKMFWHDKGSSLKFLGILNKDGSVAENKTIKENTKPFSKQTNVKIKQENNRWHIYLETVDGDDCLTPVGFETKELAEHAAMMKGYNFKGNPYSEDYEGLEVEKPTKREKVKGLKEPEEMKLSKEKEIKLESLIKKAIKEIQIKKKVNLKEELTDTVKEQLRNLKQLQQQIAEAKAQVDAVIKSTGLKDLEKSADKLLKEELWDFFNELKKDEQRLVDLGDIIMTVVKFQSEPATYEYEKVLDFALTQVNQDVKEKILMQLKASEKIGKTKGSVSFATKTEATGNSIWNQITNFLGKFIPALKRKGQKIDTEISKLKNLVAKIKKVK